MNRGGCQSTNRTGARRENTMRVDDDAVSADLVVVDDQFWRNELERHSAMRHAIRPALARPPTPLESLGIHRQQHQVRARAPFPCRLKAHGLALFGRGLWTEAAQAFAEAAAKLPGDAAVQHDLGAALLEAGRGREAASAFDRALVIDPDRVASWHNLGSAEQAGGNMPAALTAYAQPTGGTPAACRAWHRNSLLDQTGGSTCARPT